MENRACPSLRGERTSPLIVQVRMVNGNCVKFFCSGPNFDANLPLLPLPTSGYVPAYFDIRPYSFQLWWGILCSRFRYGLHAVCLSVSTSLSEPNSTIKRSRKPKFTRRLHMFLADQFWYQAVKATHAIYACVCYQSLRDIELKSLRIFCGPGAISWLQTAGKLHHTLAVVAAPFVSFVSSLDL